MKRIIVAVIGLMLVSSGAFALDFSGYLKTDWRMLVDGSGRFDYNRNDIDLSLKHDLNSGAKVFAEMDLKNLGFATTTELYDLSNKSLVNPWTFEIKEAYLDLTGLFLKGLDVRIGKQRITWGTADRFNPTDNINPLDLSDIMDFGKRLGTNSIKATYYLGDCYFQGVYVPVFVPAVLPSDISSLFPMPTLPSPLTMGTFADTVFLPETNFTNSMFAVKAGGKIFGFDSSISYFYGNDGLPLDKKTIVTMTGPTTADIAVELYYPKMQVIGLDAAGSVGDVGVWAEAGYFIPEQFDTSAVTVLGTTTGTKLKDAYTKFTVGADYTFPVVEIYSNIQYCHGFFDERAADIKDYLVAELEKKFFSDKLKLSLSGFFEMDFKGGEHFFPSFTVLPEISYSPFEATEILLGAYFIDSWPNGKFYSSKEGDEMYLKIKYSF